MLSPVVERAVKVGARARAVISVPWRASRIAEENAKLQNQLQLLTSSNAAVLELQRENQELRNELNFLKREKHQLAIARVIARVKDQGITLLLLNQGQSAGIRIGQPAVSDGVLIGKVTKVTSSSSVVAPLTAAGVKTAATLAGDRRAAGIVEGEFNLNLVMRFIPKDVAIAENTVIITSGIEEYIPRGLLIGLAKQVQSGPQDLFQTSYLQSLIKGDEILIVSIITGITQESTTP